MHEDSTKRCNACGEQKPFSSYWQSKRYADGLWPYCKDCEYQRRRIARGITEVRLTKVQQEEKRAQEQLEERKVCSVCGIAKPFAEFYRNYRSTDSLQSRCKDCHVAKMEPHEKARTKRIRDDPERLEQKRARDREYAKKYREQNREAISRRGQTRYQRARIQRNLAIDVLLRYGTVCYLCGRPITGASDLHIDHVVPCSQGGDSRLDNLRPTHRTCNQRKGDRSLEELEDDGRFSGEAQ